MFGAIEAIKDKITKRPKIGDIVASPEKAHKGRSHGDVILKRFTGVSVPQPQNTRVPKLRGEARAAKTMTIGDIQSELKKAIAKKLPNNVIYLVRNNRETINKEINSGENSEIIDLVDKAADVKASKGKAAYQMAEDKDNEEFLEIVDNARKRLAELKNRQSKSKLEKVDKAHEEQPVNAGQFYQNLFPDFFDEFNEEESHEGIENLKLEEFISQLRGSVDNNTVNNIISVIADNLELINQELAGDKKDEIEKLLKEAADVKDDKGNSVPQILDSPEKLTKEEKGVLKLFNSLKNIMPSALEATDEEGEAPPDVTEQEGDHESIGILKYVSTSQENFLSWSDFDILPTNGNNIKTSTKSPLEPSTDQDLHEFDSDQDSGVWSPESSPKKAKDSLEKSVGSKKSSLLSNTGSDTEEEGIEPKLQEEFPPAAKPLPLLNKERPKGPSGRRASSRRLRNHEDRTQEPTPVVIPVLETRIQKEQKQIEAPTTRVTLPLLAVIPARNAGIQKEQKQIPVLATRVTLPPQEKGPALDAAKAPNQVTEEPKVIEKKKKKENIFPVEQKPANNRSFYFAATAICTLGAVACFAIAGFMSANKTEFATSSIAVLFFIGIGFAATAGITWCLTPPPPSSELSPVGLTHQAAKGDDKLNIGYL